MSRRGRVTIDGKQVKCEQEHDAHWVYLAGTRGRLKKVWWCPQCLEVVVP